jgi:hypothetical protein
MLDSAIAPEDALTYTWPKPEALRDLAFARLLPVRQSIGQFLAAYSPELLVGGLVSVTVSHTPALTAEARALARWLRQRVEACGATDVDLQLTPTAGDGRRLGITFEYSGVKNSFRWTGDLDSQQALFEAKYGDATTRLPAAVSILPPENALSEAMFF